jgi:hypothetical protein
MSEVVPNDAAKDDNRRKPTGDSPERDGEGGAVHEAASDVSNGVVETGEQGDGGNGSDTLDVPEQTANEPSSPRHNEKDGAHDVTDGGRAVRGADNVQSKEEGHGQKEPAMDPDGNTKTEGVPLSSKVRNKRKTKNVEVEELDVSKVDEAKKRVEEKVEQEKLAKQEKLKKQVVEEEEKTKKGKEKREDEKPVLASKAEETEKVPVQVDMSKLVKETQGEFRNFKPVMLSEADVLKMKERQNQTFRQGGKRSFVEEGMAKAWNEIIDHVKRGKPVFFNGPPAAFPRTFYDRDPAAVRSIVRRGDKLLSVKSLPYGQFHCGLVTSKAVVNQLRDAGFLIIGVISSRSYMENNTGRDVKAVKSAMSDYNKVQWLYNNFLISGRIEKPCRALGILLGRAFQQDREGLAVSSSSSGAFGLAAEDEGTE